MADTKICLAATGHRPNKLGGYSQSAQEVLHKLATNFLLESKPDKIISGMALGWDMAWARAAQRLGIPVIAAVPFAGQESIWPVESRRAYVEVLNKCADVVYVCEQGYAPWKMQIRNQWMVDNCTSLVALWNGTEGGTANCVKYAEKMYKPIINLWERFETTEREE